MTTLALILDLFVHFFNFQFYYSLGFSIFEQVWLFIGGLDGQVF